MKMIVSLLCIIFFLIFSNFLLAEMDIELLKQNYPKCENSDYRHECFDNVSNRTLDTWVILETTRYGKVNIFKMIF